MKYEVAPSFKNDGVGFGVGGGVGLCVTAGVGVGVGAGVLVGLGELVWNDAVIVCPGSTVPLVAALVHAATSNTLNTIAAKLRTDLPSFTLDATEALGRRGRLGGRYQ